MRICTSCQNGFLEAAPFCPHCGGTESVLPADPLIGRTLDDRYHIESKLGEGGMARVYLAHREPQGDRVVVKVLHPDLVCDGAMSSRFVREARTASQLRHPNSIAIYEFGEAQENTPYIAMEFVRGRSLYEVLLQDRRLGPTRIARVVTQVLDVLEAAHALGIVHRDLKPENIMVDDTATQLDFVKVLDFGLAKAVGLGATRITATGAVFGTLQYMSPEQAMGRDVDARADLYAVAVICYELLTGQLPFAGDAAAVVAALRRRTPVPPVLSVMPKASAALAGFIDAALDPDVELRPQSAASFSKQLRAACGHKAPTDTLVCPTSFGPDPPIEQGRARVQSGWICGPRCAQCGTVLPMTRVNFCGGCGRPMREQTANER